MRLHGAPSRDPRPGGSPTSLKDPCEALPRKRLFIYGHDLSRGSDSGTSQPHAAALVCRWIGMAGGQLQEEEQGQRLPLRNQGSPIFARFDVEIKAARRIGRHCMELRIREDRLAYGHAHAWNSV
jgi:hypothetical protein